MCISGEEEAASDGAGTSASADSSIPEIVVTASRLGLDPSALDNVDWAEVAKVSTYLGIGGLVTGGPYTGIVGAITGAAAAAETQDGVDLEDLFVIKDDMILVSGVPGGVSLH